MKRDTTKEGIRHLRKIEGELGDIKEATESWRGWFVRGAMQGAGFLVGTIIAVILVGWFLAFLGIVPWFDDIATYLRSVVDSSPRF